MNLSKQIVQIPVQREKHFANKCGKSATCKLKNAESSVDGFLKIMSSMTNTFKGGRHKGSMFVRYVPVK